MNNCTVCSKPVDEHLEGRETDLCVAEKLGLCINDKDMVLETWEKDNQRGGHRYPLPHYSSPTMSAECWGLVKKIKTCWTIYPEGDSFVFFLDWDNDHSTIKAPTAPLAIIRAFLCVEK